MGYAQVYTEAGIPKMWGKFQMSKECAENLQELFSGMMHWYKTNGIEIDTAVFFVNLEIEETEKKPTREARWQCMKMQKVEFQY